MNIRIAMWASRLVNFSRDFLNCLIEFLIYEHLNLFLKNGKSKIDSSFNFLIQVNNSFINFIESFINFLESLVNFPFQSLE